jgi:succinyl-CoA synthetase beta subunit
VTPKTYSVEREPAGRGPSAGRDALEERARTAVGAHADRGVAVRRSDVHPAVVDLEGGDGVAPDVGAHQVEADAFEALPASEVVPALVAEAVRSVERGHARPPGAAEREPAAEPNLGVVGVAERIEVAFLLDAPGAQRSSVASFCGGRSRRLGLALLPLGALLQLGEPRGPLLALTRIDVLAAPLHPLGELGGVARGAPEERAADGRRAPERNSDEYEHEECLDELLGHGSLVVIASSVAGLNARTRVLAPSVRVAPPVDLYEYQGKELFARFGIPVSDGRFAASPEEARRAAAELGGKVVVKAQVLTGGRGKAGGIKLADTAEEAEARASEILGLDIRGHTVRKLWIEKASDIAKEYYLSVTFDRGEKKPLFMLTTQGGMDIEEVAERTPEALAKLHVDPLIGFQPYQARWLCFTAGVRDPDEQKQVIALVGRLYEAFVGADAMLCEVNPLIVTPAGEVKALDSKFSVDDNALYRHPDIAEMRDVEAADPQERLAREKGVTYVKLDGEIGILGNGAGLVMSTLDVIDQVGGSPANFCDLGGGGDAEGVVEALEVITSDPQVRAILFNIFGGITRGDEVARGILEALQRMTIEDPIVVRLDGTNAEEGRRMLVEAAPANLHVEETMLSAAEKVVELAGTR